MARKEKEDIRFVTLGEEEQQTPEWMVDEFSGFRYSPKEVIEIRSLDDVDYGELYRIAQRLGFTGSRKKKSTIVTYVGNQMEEYGLELEDIVETERLPETPLIPLHEEFCVRAKHPIEAKLLITDRGLETAIRNDVPYDQWRALDVGVWKPSRCGMRLKWHGKDWYLRRLHDSLIELRECGIDDDNCVNRQVRRVKHYQNKLRQFPLTGWQKCFCGIFELLQSERTNTEHRRRLTVRRTEMLADELLEEIGYGEIYED